MSDPPAEHIDLLCSADGDFNVAPNGNVEPLDSAPSSHPQPGSLGPTAGAHERRPWVGIEFACCGVYRRVYREPHESWYVGRCPCCGRQARLRVGPHGTHARIFVAKPL